MSIMKRFISNEFTEAAQLLVYENVVFPHGFAKFLQALVVENITSTDPVRQSHPKGYQWINEVSTGGIQLETSTYPYNTHHVAGNLTIKGPTQSLEIVHSILERQEAIFDGTSVPPEVEYHNRLNPLLWDDHDGEYTLQDDVQESLDAIAEEFVVFMELPKLQVEDVTLTGSSANFNWNKFSDIDMHIVIDMKQAEKKYGKLCAQYFDACKKVWNNLHDITIKGLPLEIYVQDKHEVHNSTGVYSILNEEWIVEPSYEEPNIDNNDVELKTNEWIDATNKIISSNNPTAIAVFMEKLSRLRKAGLEKVGEFSVENLAFKALRNGGYLDMLVDTKTKIWDDQMSLSIDGINTEDEEELSPWEELGYSRKKTIPATKVGPAPKKSRLNLNVPYAHIQAAKKAGAVWDPGIRRWYVMVTPEQLKTIPQVWR